jgi:glycosyltransferase involved in cell wall biosynthesis
MKLTIVIPCYNEAKNIPLILERFERVIKRGDIELILVNNGSVDNSQDVLNDLIPKYSFVRGLTIEQNQGYGHGIAAGLREARGEFVGYTHADMQTDPADVLKAFDIIEHVSAPEKCFVKGRRRGRPFKDMLFTWGMSFFESLYFKMCLWDINAQPNIFPQTFFNSLQDLPLDFSLDLYLLYQAKKQGLNIVRFDVVFPKRMHGRSSWNTGILSKWRFIKRTVLFSHTLKRRL